MKKFEIEISNKEFEKLSAVIRGYSVVSFTDEEVEEVGVDKLKRLIDEDIIIRAFHSIVNSKGKRVYIEVKAKVL